MASYDQLKELFLRYTPLKDNYLLHFTCGFSAGCIACAIASPFDVVKTRLMSKPDMYPSLPAAFVTMLRDEGPMAFYKGVIPNVVRLSLWSTILFMTMEQIKAMWVPAHYANKKH